MRRDRSITVSEFRRRLELELEAYENEQREQRPNGKLDADQWLQTFLIWRRTPVR